MTISIQNNKRLRACIEVLASLSDAAWQDIAALFSEREIRQGESFVRAGEKATEIAFVVEGALREYFITQEGSEYNKSFVISGDFTGSLFDLLSGQPSIATIEAIKNTRVLVADYQAFSSLYDTHPCCQKLGRLIAESLFCKKALREYEFLTMDAATRYRQLLARHPGIEVQVPQFHIASYLGITPVALSRIRRRLS